MRDAWIVRRGTEARVLAMHSEHRAPPEPGRWVTLRAASPEGVRVARGEGVILLSRTEAGPDGAPVDVTVAYLP